MAEIRSSLDIALEKAARLGSVDKEEMARQTRVERGRRLAVTFLQSRDATMRSLLEGVDPQGFQDVMAGVFQVLMRNIILPRDEQRTEIDRALAGIGELKGSSARGILSQIDQLIDAYLQNKKHYYEQLKVQMEGKLGGLQEAMAQQYGMRGMARLSAESIPQFQQEWAKLSSEIAEQFQQRLDLLKANLEHL